MASGQVLDLAHLESASRSFDDLPISEATKEALKECQFTVMTPVQALSLPASLGGQDVLAQAKTGTGELYS